MANQKRRIASLMLHTSPLEQAGTGDAGGMNVYVLESAKRIAASGVDVILEAKFLDIGTDLCAFWADHCRSACKGDDWEDKEGETLSSTEWFSDFKSASRNCFTRTSTLIFQNRETDY